VFALIITFNYFYGFEFDYIDIHIGSLHSEGGKFEINLFEF